LIRAIKLRGPSIAYDIVDGFTNILHRHRHTLSPPFPCLTHLELSCTRDPLVTFLPNIIHRGLRTLTLPHDDVLLDPVMSCLLRILPPIQTLAYVSTSHGMRNFVNNIHLFPFLRDLTVSLTLEASDLLTIMSHPSLQSLTLVISLTLPALQPIAFGNRIRSLNLDFRKSLLNPLDTAIALLHRFPVPCQQLGILLPNQLNGDTLHNFLQLLAGQSDCTPYANVFSLSNLTQFTIRVDGFTPRNCVPVPSNVLEPLYPFLLTHVCLGSFNTCHLDDDDLHMLSDAMPQLEKLSLGTSCYWTTPPRASLAGVAAVLRNCRALTQLGLVFSCSLGRLDFDILPVNKCITSLNVGISPPYNHYAVAHFLSRALPNLCRTHIEYLDLALSRHNHILADRVLRIKGWHNILAMRSTVERPLSYSCINL
jgi:hypothetical protein